MSILSIQSHVVYGYVGNKAAVYPLQSMGIDVWPINTVQFSSHTGYGACKGEIFSASHIKELVDGLEQIGVLSSCRAIISGYMGSSEICAEVLETVNKVKGLNKDAIYLCDPVIGNTNPYVKPEVLEFFKTKMKADIITPNQFEAEILSGKTITCASSLKEVADYFHHLGVKIVIITGLELANMPSTIQVFISQLGGDKNIILSQKQNLKKTIYGTGDLFSALFLGYYLLDNNCLLALQKSVYYMNKVLKNTIEREDSELQVTSVVYHQPPLANLPEIVTLI